MSKPDEREAQDLVQQLGAGKLTRRQFVTRASALGLSAGAIGSILAACGGGEEEEAAPPAPPEEAPPPEPEAAPPAAPTEASDAIAVEAAKQFAGTTINIVWESGLQANDPKIVWGPDWEELTGIKINVIELDHADIFTKGLAEHIAGSGAHDILTIEPAWIPDFAAAGAIIPVDDFIGQYLNPADLEDYHPLYKGMSVFQGQNYGFFDDGDTLILYYRKDLFEELGLSPPATWDEIPTIAQKIRDAKGGDVFGADFWRNPTFQQWSFLPGFQGQGGVPFDPATMDATINSDVGVTVLEQILAQNKVAPPGVEQHDPVTVLTRWLEGNVGMMWWWPPPGRWSAGYGGAGEKGFEFVAESQVVDKVGYAVLPGGGWHAAGFVCAVTANSKNQEAAYLTAQWFTSPVISLKRVTQPIALRDPYRLSHYSSEEYRGLWADAGAYLDTLKQAANVTFTDWAIPGWQEYALAIDKAVTSVMGGADPKGALDQAAKDLNAVTDKLGRDKQIEFWNAYLQTPGSSADTTIEKLGQAV